MSYQLIQADARRLPLADGVVQCCVTSPPYYGLRDYGVAGQIGLEATPEAFVANMVAVFREVRWVLSDDGVCFVNLGDSYSSTPGGEERDCSGGFGGRDKGTRGLQPSTGSHVMRVPRHGLKPKDLLGIPWRVAFALQADGWYLRSDIIWHKPNPMPESVTDRPTKSHEYIFLLSKSERYYWDADAVREPHVEPWRGKGDPAKYAGSSEADRVSFGIGGSTRVRTGTFGNDPAGTERVYNPAGRNLRSVWTITPKPFAGAHFATFPPELAERCIKAGTSERGACPRCRSPWRRVVERGESDYAALGRNNGTAFGRHDSQPGNMGQTRTINGTVPSLKAAQSSTLGWAPSCTCPPHDPVPCVVLDPFSGAGTVALVADGLGRHGIGIELSADYCRMARHRITRPHAPVVKQGRVEHHPLFAAGEM